MITTTIDRAGAVVSKSQGGVVLIENDMNQPIALFKLMRDGSIYMCTRGEPRFQELFSEESGRSNLTRLQLAQSA